MTTSENTPAARREPIRGKVARVLDTRSIAINRGEADGVQIGMRFVVLNPRGFDIKDPDTGKDLGPIEIPKIVVKVVKVNGPHLSTARTFRSLSSSPKLSSLTTLQQQIAEMARLTRAVGLPATTEVETLRMSDRQNFAEDLDEKDSIAREGDPVREFRGDEFGTA